MSELQQTILDWIAKDEEELVQFYSDFVKARSPNPPGDTREAIGFVSGRLGEWDIDHDIVAPKEAMPNIVADFDTCRAGRHLVLNGHADVFPIGNPASWERDPWSGEVLDGRVWGRGATDMKAGTTAAIYCYRYLHRLRDRLNGRLALTVVSDEETGGRWGAGYLLETMPDRVKGDCVLNGEPGGTDTIRFGEKGIIRFKVTVRTRGAHSPYPHLSPSAIDLSCGIMRGLKEMAGQEGDIPSDILAHLNKAETRAVIDRIMGDGTADVIKQYTVNIGTISGGTSANMIADQCEFMVDIREPIGTPAGKTFARAQEIVAATPGAEISDVSITPTNWCATRHDMLDILDHTVRSLGRPSPVLLPSLGGSDCRYWRGIGVPAYIYGPSPRNIAAPNESGSIDDLLHVVRVHTLAAARYLAG
ncbi:M20/M25/M40 family metallo-hydrolase [Geminicoccaceae bacterium 1502E]|nr:M20/M25/M40 family metallo-hydrolase [Geminicoccaceae bacterium 1502E]